jgi:hypothetical protein
LNGRRFPRTGSRRAAKALVLAAVFSFGCGAKVLSVGPVPFPAEKPVFVGETGEETASLPRFPEPLRLVFLDSPWCPQCGEAWEAIKAAASTFPPGSIRVYRIRFDSERIYEREGSRETAPFHPAAAPPGMTTGKPGPAPLPVTTLRALPGPFQKQFRVPQTPVLLLLDQKGTIAKRWTGSSPSLAASLGEEVRRITVSSPPMER